MATLMMTLASMILLPTRVMSYHSLDEAIVEVSPNVRSFDVFHLSSSGEMLVKLDLDMMLPLKKFRRLLMSGQDDGFHPPATHDLLTIWPGGKIFYEISPEAEDSRDEIQSVLQYFESVTCLVFRENSSHPARFRVIRGKECSSHVGMLGSVQDLTLSHLCPSSVLLHLIGHVVGFIHEHQRPDRDQYVQMQMLGLTPSREKTYMPWSPLDLPVFKQVGYDYRSIMHFSGRGRMITRDPRFQGVIGTGRKLSFKDIQKANLMYRCSVRAGCPNITCPFHGFVLSRNYKNAPPCTCWCDSGDSFDPLIPCAFLSRSNIDVVVLHNPTQDSPPKDVKAGAVNVCADLLPNCADLKKQGTCSKNIMRMAASCPTSCRYCEKRFRMCLDFEISCEIMAQAGTCQKNGLADFMKDLCPRSCGSCQTLLSPCESRLAFSLSEKNKSGGRLGGAEWLIQLGLICLLVCRL